MRGTNCALWAPHRQLGFVIYVAIVRSRSGMQLQFNVSACGASSLEPSLDKSSKRVMDDEERPAQTKKMRTGLPVCSFLVKEATRLSLLPRRHTEVSTLWILALADVQATVETPSYLSNSRFAIVSPLPVQQVNSAQLKDRTCYSLYKCTLLNCLGTMHHMCPRSPTFWREACLCAICIIPSTKTLMFDCVELKN